MLNAFVLQDEKLCQLTGDAIAAQLCQAFWIDLINPSQQERSQVDLYFPQALPEAEAVDEIEASARSFEDESGLHIHALFLHLVDGQPRNTTVAFTLNGQRLLSLRERDVPAFRLLRLRAKHEAGLLNNAASVLIALFESAVEELADLLEQIHTDLESVSQAVMARHDNPLDNAIDKLATLENINGKIRLCLMDAQRALNFLIRRGRLNQEENARVHEVLRDLDSLLPHSTFLFDKVNFLMDAAQGFINIQQNQIIKIFSIAAVVFLPPTLIASIYGMNFQHMPELHWAIGYPLALLLMVLSAIAPYWYFKRQGWL